VQLGKGCAFTNVAGGRVEKKRIGYNPVKQMVKGNSREETRAKGKNNWKRSRGGRHRMGGKTRWGWPRNVGANGGPRKKVGCFRKRKLTRNHSSPSRYLNEKCTKRDWGDLGKAAF